MNFFDFERLIVNIEEKCVEERKKNKESEKEEERKKNQYGKILFLMRRFSWLSKERKQDLQKEEIERELEGVFQAYIKNKMDIFNSLCFLFLFFFA